MNENGRAVQTVAWQLAAERMKDISARMHARGND